MEEEVGESFIAASVPSRAMRILAVERLVTGLTDDLLLACLRGDGGLFERVRGLEDGRLRDRGDLAGGVRGARAD